MTAHLDKIVIVLYLLFLVGMGAAFRSFNRNIDDYIRGGAQGTWWLVGTSILMSGISAFTFTGNSGAAYEAGFTPLIIYIAQVFAYLVAAIWLAPWFRQTRVLTGPEIFRTRFGIEVEQFISYFSFIVGTVTASLALWGVATFCSVIFEIPIEWTILGLGLVTLAYSTAGGRWGVMATDFVQSLVLFPITILVAVLSLHAVGGISGFVDKLQGPELHEAYQLIKEPGAFPAGKYSVNWIFATFLIMFFQGLSFSNAPKYFSVKDGREARYAALMAGVLMGIGGLIWFIPPMVGRMLFSEEIASAALSNPHEAAYAVVARNLLPNGLLGVMVIAMFSATMSSLDTGLNGAAGIVVRNIIPPIRDLFGREELSHKGQLYAGKITTLCLGVSIIGMAFYLSQQKDLGLFDAFFTLTTVIGLPTAVPAIVAVFIRPLPRWSYFVVTGAGALVSLTSVIQETVFDIPWTVQERTFWVFGVGTVACLATIPFYWNPRFTSERFRERVDAFYRQMHTPVDFAKEIVESRDFTQLQMIGFFSIGLGVFICFLVLLPNPWAGRLSILFVGGFSIGIGSLLRFAAYRLQQRERRLRAGLKPDAPKTDS
ncbi:MAG: Uncharacterized protein E1N59_3201 [Puniceicoccaceae bacterium 5H]|nr:MAG: Uncharacterized protein E1N59_3201 [Puniceicoccaceae bacterium 5H]